MGISRSSIAFLAAASHRGVDFDRTLTIGRQRIATTPKLIRAGLSEAGVQASSSEIDTFVADRGYCESFLRHLGARVTDSIDASDYEGATIVHDMNDPLPRDFWGKYSLVIDGGSLEHVFNFPVALKSCLEAVAVGGHYVAITPVNNYTGHGFYQFTPELYYRVLGEQNGFAVRCMLWRPKRPFATWRLIADPLVVGRRVERVSIDFARSLLYVVAKRVSLRDVLAEYPQQSDYVAKWSRGNTPSRPSMVRRFVKGSAVGAGAVRRFRQWSPPLVEDTENFIWQRYGEHKHRADFERVSLRHVEFT